MKDDSEVRRKIAEARDKLRHIEKQLDAQEEILDAIKEEEKQDERRIRNPKTDSH
jgi:septal ring factor EnvC (AmiA/AmiB activator)